MHTTGLVGDDAFFGISRSRPTTRTTCSGAVMMPVVPHYQQFEERFGLRLTTCYAMTEIGRPSAPAGTSLDPMSCGVLRDGYEVRLVDDRDFEVPVGEPGELIVRHREPWVLCQGYFEMPERTAEAWRNGWFHTGDAFRKDAPGGTTSSTALSDAIRRRGENISLVRGRGARRRARRCRRVRCNPGPVGVGRGRSEGVRGPRRQHPDRGAAAARPDPADAAVHGAAVRRVRRPPPQDRRKDRAAFEAVLQSALNEHTWDREAAGVEVPKS